MSRRFVGICLGCLFLVAGCSGSSADNARPQVLSAEALAIIDSQNAMPTLVPVSGLHIRRTLSDYGYIANTTAAQARSPDIIPTGGSLIADPQGTFGTLASYGEDYGDATILAGQNNYIYVRAKNFSATSADADVYLYYAPAGLFLTPDQWKDNLIRTKSGADHATLSAASAGAVAVTSDPFVFRPLYSQPYSLIARLTPVNQPSTFTEPLTTTSKYLNWVPGSGTAYRTIVPVKNGQPVTAMFTIQNPDATEKQFFFVLRNDGLPPGTRVILSGDSRTSTPIRLESKIQDGQSLYGITTTLDAGHKSNLYVTINQGAAAIQPGAKLLVFQRVYDDDSSRDGPAPVYIVGEASIVFY